MMTDPIGCRLMPLDCSRHHTNILILNIHGCESCVMNVMIGLDVVGVGVGTVLCEMLIDADV